MKLSEKVPFDKQCLQKWKQEILFSELDAFGLWTPATPLNLIQDENVASIEP